MPLSLLQLWKFVIATAGAPELSDSSRRAAIGILSHYNSKTGRCYPSFPRIAKVAGLSLRTTFSAVEKLESAGWFRVSHETGRGHTNEYQPVMERVSGATPFMAPETVSPATPFTATERVQDSALKGAASRHKGCGPQQGNYLEQAKQLNCAHAREDASLASLPGGSSRSAPGKAAPANTKPKPPSAEAMMRRSAEYWRKIECHKAGGASKATNEAADAKQRAKRGLSELDELDELE